MIVIPVHNLIVLPNTTVYLPTDIYKQITEKKPEIGERIVFVFTRSGTPGIESEEDIYPIGVNGTISEIAATGFVSITTFDRTDIESIRKDDTGYKLTMVRRPDIDDLSEEEEKKKTEEVKSAITRFFSTFQWAPIARSFIAQRSSIAEIICMMSGWFTLSNEERYALVEEDSLSARTEKMERIIYEYLEMYKLDSEAQSAQEQDNQKAYRESAIRKQMEFLQKELDEIHPEEVTDVRRFEKKIEELPLNEDARKEARKVLNRMKQEGKNSPEYGLLYDYLDFVTNLPWKTPRSKKIDLGEAEKILEEDHFGLKKVKERILQQIAVMDLNKKQSGSILLFVGAPGTGKTSIGQSIAKALKRKYVRVALGGIRDEADIRGHRRTYIGAMPGRIMDGISRSGAADPVMVLDEVDKLASSYNGDPASALLEVLDPEQNFSFTDHYLNVPYDLSRVFFICTANTLDSIPEPLLNRMEVIDFNGYTETEKYEIARRHLIPRSLEDCGLKEGELTISDEALRSLISDYTMEAGVRGLKKAIDTVCRYAAVKFVRSHKKKKVLVEKDDLEKILDRHPIRHEHVLAEKRPGIVTGLAWTRAGGEILFVETLLTKGSGKVIVTGQLGEVMKESATIAVSLVKSMFPEKAELLETHDLHIHVPEGAVPKDGPSAGITLTTALASLLTERAVAPRYAMTGEVSLRGVVLPIGGLPEKLMAAQRAGIKTVFIPKENENDLKDVAKEVKRKLKIIPVSTVEEVLRETKVLL
ncbi:MAG: endopeptidase La [Erysipelotrichaceae bacterium]|nr:endopeptidase La [Erysipelotrichaceae bacterium]